MLLPVNLPFFTTARSISLARIFYGALGATRMPDPLLKRQLLLPTELQAHICTRLSEPSSIAIQFNQSYVIDNQWTVVMIASGAVHDSNRFNK